MQGNEYAGKKFGEVAAEHNYIVPSDIDKIMDVEEEINLRIGKIMVMSGYITQGECDKCYSEFKESL